jgi:Right handed beta helix region
MGRIEMRTSGIRRIFAAALLTAQAGMAAIYYVDNNTGADTNSGATPATAWSSLARVAAAQLAPGDYVLLRRGQVWQERLSIRASGSADAPIVFGAYGTGAAPAIDGQGVSIPQGSGLVALSGRSYIVIENLEIRNSSRDALVPYLANQLTIDSCAIHDNRFNGILAFDGNNISILNSDIYNNNLDTTLSYDGIEIDGSGLPQSNFLIRGNSIHDNIGGYGWLSANGINLGHTGGATAVLQGVVVEDNNIYRNGDPSQNQAGRGITGAFNGDVTITGNKVWRNASAGIYIGGEGLAITIAIRRLHYHNGERRSQPDLRRRPVYHGHGRRDRRRRHVEPVE